MKTFRLFILLMFTGICTFSQDAVHNYGNIQIHNTGEVGFHMDIINDGAFNQNEGLVGFYSEDTLTISGSSNPVFHDAEVEVDNNLFVENTIGIRNNFNFILGDVITPRDESNINLNFIGDSFYNGEGSDTKIDGYASITGQLEFTFPVGQDGRLRPLSITSSTINPYAKCAYFYEDPNTPSTFSESFDTSAVETDSLSISTNEFWHLEGSESSRITLSWDDLSFASLFAASTTDLRIVGWNNSQKQWVDLGSTNIDGDLNNGTITSEEFIPNDYAIITIGGNSDALGTLSLVELDNYYMTPNGDGINDVLVIEGLENSPNNSLQIFNRYGIMVYAKQNYDNSFDGLANVKGAFSRNSGLSSGIYYYVITLDDLNEKHQGYLYLTTYKKQ
ncbi:gliding motility-associated C-terminal domain-containing protein [Maribacter sp. 2210JD10-5]|uniref:gliding motility-associated C-terminal domain-containing protein n=1 Tax=Maribacter sp. 2210JD10-5 TaxID=3386272 RepID=UPI0039BCC54A